MRLKKMILQYLAKKKGFASKGEIYEGVFDMNFRGTPQEVFNTVDKMVDDRELHNRETLKGSIEYILHH